MENYKFFQNTDCEYFPCHEMKDGEKLNCLFCYCPLYALGDKCGGDYIYTDKGVKSCVNCTRTHGKDGYEHVMSKMEQVMEAVRKKDRS